MAAALCRTIMPMPSPSTADSVVNSRAQAMVAGSAEVSPMSRPARAAPPKPAARPTAPTTSPRTAAVSVLDSAMIQRAGRAATAAARVPCWTSAPKSRTPAIAASIEVTLVQ
ncbi:hypothetical protein [Geodermatophilus obscurus]|uniref:hypothetical protein n=1 Tax=Geodermatophilus obscurus TaxID=1861 RepID=UPI00114106D5|nr:hypothetical protein [Geodermatophilus obscurus]